MSNKDALMASLMGDGTVPAPAAADDGLDQDLFGSIPLDDDAPGGAPAPTPMGGSAPVNSNDNNPLFVDSAPAPVVPAPVVPAPAPPVPTQAPPVPTPAAAPPVPTQARSSLLASSGLLGMAQPPASSTTQPNDGGGGGGGGLFDDIDREEEEKERLRLAQEAEKKRLEEERLAQEQAAAAEAARLKQQQEAEAEAERLRQIEEEQKRQQQLQQQQQQMTMQQQQQQQQPYGMPTNGMHSSNIMSMSTPSPMGGYNAQQQPQPTNDGMMQTIPLASSAMTATTSYAGTQSSYVERQKQLNSQMQGMTLSSSYHPGMTTGPTNRAATATAASVASLKPAPTTPQPQDAVGGFYRNHNPPPAAPQPQNAYSTSSSYMYTNKGGSVQQHSFAPSSMPKAAPSLTAGMHNLNNTNNNSQPPGPGQPANVPMTPQQLPPVTAPPPFQPLYGAITVSEPLLVQPPSLFNMVPPHWTYQVQANLPQGGCYLVRRRFRHVAALQDRLRQECAGSILPGK